MGAANDLKLLSSKNIKYGINNYYLVYTAALLDVNYKSDAKIIHKKI
jgi:hypothetical protein